MKRVRSSTNPTPYFFDCSSSNGCFTITSILCDQSDIGLINFLCGRWSVKWKDAQKKHYLRMYKKSCLSMDHRYTEETLADLLGLVAV